MSDNIAVEQLNMLLDSSNQFIIVVERESLKLLYANKVARQSAINDMDEIEGWNCYKYIHDYDQQCSFCPLSSMHGRVESVTQIDTGVACQWVRQKSIKWQGKNAVIEYIMDVDDLRLKSAETEQVSRKFQEIYSVLSEDYGSFFYVTLDNGLAIPYKVYDSLEARLGLRLGRAVSYTQALKKYIDTSVVAEERDEMRQFTDIDWLMKELEEKKRISHIFRTNVDGKIYYWQMQLGYIPSSEHFAVALGFLNVDKAVRKEQMRQEELQRLLEDSEKSNKRLKEQVDIISGIEKVYFAIYYGNIVNNTFDEISSPGHISEYIGKKRSMEQAIDVFIDIGVKPTSQDGMREFMDMSTMQSRLKEKDIIFFEYEAYTRGWCRASIVVASRDSNKTPVAVIFLVSDIENQVKMEMARKKELADALEEANRANRSKTVFLNNMSHDIRTPMNAIIGFSSLAEHCVDDPDKIREYLKKITLSSNHLLSLINDVLDMSRIESGKVVIQAQPWHLSGILGELQQILQVDVKNKHLNFTIDTSEVRDEYIICDKLRLNQVLLNCLGNSIKFTHTGGNVGIKVRQAELDQPDRAEYVFTVFDNGIGMSPEFASHIFEPFTREASSTISGIPGTGLGMSITKNLVELMDGTISVYSTQGQGTEFEICLAFTVVQETAAKVGMTAKTSPGLNLLASKLGGQRVLLVEDNEINREIATMFLKEMKLLVDEAENGQVALEKMRAAPCNYYDMVLMDVQMPIMNGYEATRAIRLLPCAWAKVIPIVAMTANAFAEDIETAKSAGMNDHMAKPFQPEKLKAMLEQYLCR